MRKPLLDKNSVFWVYLGLDFLKRRHIEKTLGESYVRVDISRLQEEVAKDISVEYVDWVDRLNKHYGKDIDWWFSDISSRNTYASQIFQYFCYLEVLDRIWLKDKDKPQYIVVESWGLKKAIEKWAKKRGFSPKVDNRSSFLSANSFGNCFVPFLKYGKFVIDLLMRLIAAVVSLGLSRPPKPSVFPDVIISTCILNGSFGEDTLFKDRYFPYLYNYIQEKKRNIWVHPLFFGFSFNYLSVYKKIRKSKPFFIIPEDYLRFSDYFYALSYPIRAMCHRLSEDRFRNFDIGDIIKEEFIKSLASGLMPSLIYRLFLRLGKTGINPSHIIRWYENQVIDKAFVAGVRKGLPRAIIVGVQMFIHPPNHLNLFPSQSEAEAGMLPDVLLETSPYQCQIAQRYTKKILCKTAAALRYAHLFDDSFKRELYKGKKKTIFVLLPFVIIEAVEILEMVKELSNRMGNDVYILVKLHPDYTREELMKFFGRNNWPNKFNIFEGSLSEGLKQTDVVISSNSSSSVEAAARGVPVVLVGRQTALNQNNLSGLKLEIVTECFSISELFFAVNSYFAIAADRIYEFEKMGKEIRELFFTAVNEETLRPYLEFDEVR